MKISVWQRIKAVFVKDKYEYWFNEFSNEEQKLLQMDVWKLAEVIVEDKTLNTAETNKKRIVAEHFLDIRISRIQAKAAWGSAIIAFFGAIIGASIPLLISSAINQHTSININCPDKYWSERENHSSLMKTTLEPFVKFPEALLNNKIVEIPPSKYPTVENQNKPKDNAQPKRLIKQ